MTRKTSPTIACKHRAIAQLCEATIFLDLLRHSAEADDQDLETQAVCVINAVLPKIAAVRAFLDGGSE